MAQINVTKTPIAGLYIIDPCIHGDERGYFTETYNPNDFAEYGLTMRFVQDNESMSRKGVLRGLHFQKQHPQGKLVRALQGAVYDVAVDLRQGSATFGQWYGVELSHGNHRMFYIPEGFAHGYLTLTDTAVFAYKVTDFYHPGDEGGIRWNDPEVGVVWPRVEGERMADGTPLIINERDRHFPGLSQLFD